MLDGIANQHVLHQDYHEWGQVTSTQHHIKKYGPKAIPS